MEAKFIEMISYKNFVLATLYSETRHYIVGKGVFSFETLSMCPVFVKLLPSQCRSLDLSVIQLNHVQSIIFAVAGYLSWILTPKSNQTEKFKASKSFLLISTEMDKAEQ